MIKPWYDRLPKRLPEDMWPVMQLQFQAMGDEINDLRQCLSKQPAGYLWEPDGSYTIGQETVFDQSPGPCSGWKITPLYKHDTI